MFKSTVNIIGISFLSTLLFWLLHRFNYCLSLMGLESNALINTLLFALILSALIPVKKTRFNTYLFQGFLLIFIVLIGVTILPLYLNLIKTCDDTELELYFPLFSAIITIVMGVWVFWKFVKISKSILSTLPILIIAVVLSSTIYLFPRLSFINFYDAIYNRIVSIF